MAKVLRSENDVKAVVKDWFDGMESWHYAPVQTAMGVHGIHDRVGAVSIVVTPQMVGKKIAVLTSIESKRPGRRGEKYRGMSHHQLEHMEAINAAGGLSICCDGHDDLTALNRRLYELITAPLNG